MKNRVSCAEGIPSTPPSMPPERRGVRLHKWHIISFVLALIVIVQLMMYINLNLKYDSLSSDNNSLKEQHSALESSYNTLKTQHSSLQTQYYTLRGTHDSLQSNFTTLSSNFTELKNQFDSLDSNFSSLQIQYDSLQSNYTDLYARYNSLQTQNNTFILNYDHLRYVVNQRCLHLDISKFITPDDSSVEQIVTQVTGGWSDPSDLDEFWSDVKAMYDWVANNIEYRYDGLYPVIPIDSSFGVYYTTEMWQFSNETLDERKGDCEDMAILLTSMILNYDAGEYWTECIWITGALSAHVAVQIPVSGNKITILDPAGNYYTSDAWGNLDQKDLSTEINDWLNYWKPDIGSDVCVERVFSNDLDKSFSSTNEYISWMSNR
jgi:FtsZ-binding cell division protein ZapB